MHRGAVPGLHVHAALLHVEQVARKLATAEGGDLAGESEFLFEFVDRQARFEIEQRSDSGHMSTIA